MAAFLALRCYACGMFQVKQQKKSSKKWCCSICNEKQSVCKVYGSSGAAKDIRQLVQRLNYSVHVQEERTFTSAVDDLSTLDDDKKVEVEAGVQIVQEHSNKRSKWDEYLENQEAPVAYESCEDQDDLNYVTVIPDHRRKKPKEDAVSHQSKIVPLSLVEEPVKRPKLDCSFLKEDKFAASDTTKRIALLTENYTKFQRVEERCGNQMAVSAITKPKNAVSKWSEYLEENGNELNMPVNKKISCSSKWNTGQQLWNDGDTVKTEFQDEIVTDDIHPAFL